MNSVKNFFNTRRGRLFLIMAATTLFAFSLTMFRMYKAGLNPLYNPLDLFERESFFFLSWNLFLAWLPYLFSLYLARLNHVGASKIMMGMVFLAWLLFFPNAPYIVTDFLHLRERPPYPAGTT